eukprot:COSAG06_NODE_4463_length_4229_cov_5.105569_3_plen_48_part_00
MQDTTLKLKSVTQLDYIDMIIPRAAGLPMTPGEPPQRITYNSAHRWM